MQVDTFQIETDASVAPTGRALVALDQADGGRNRRPSAVFVAQLIAFRRNLQAYRKARRESPDTVVSRYAGAASAPITTFDRAF